MMEEDLDYEYEKDLPSYLCASPVDVYKRKFCMVFDPVHDLIACYNRSLSKNPTGIWESENAFASTLPQFLLQLVFIVFVNRILSLIFRPMLLPRICAQILGGILIGSTFIASTKVGLDFIFPYRSMMTLETIGNLSLMYYMFLVGLEIEVRPIFYGGKTALTIALSGLIFPLFAGFSIHMYITKEQRMFPEFRKTPGYYGFIFWGFVLATTNFPDLAHILADLKLLHSKVGKTALSSAVIADMCSWLLLVIAVIVTNPEKLYYKIPLTISYIVFFFFAVRPILSSIICRTSKEDNYTESHVCFVLSAVVISGYVSDYIGCHSILGGFLFGLAFPKGELKNVVMEKIKDFVSEILMPIFFLNVGLRTNWNFLLQPGTTKTMIIMVIFIAVIVKATFTFLTALLLEIPIRDSFALGMLMNTKGILTLIIMNVGRDTMGLDVQKFGILVIAIWIMTAMVGPVLAFTYSNITTRLGNYNKRTIRSIGTHSEFRILNCLHSMRNVTGFMNLIEASIATKQSPIFLFVVQLVELVGHASTMRIVHDTMKNIEQETQGAPHSSNHFATSFAELTSRNENVQIENITVVSSYSTMHQDICTLADEKRTTFILLPLEVEATIDCSIDNTNSPFRAINKNVLENAHCSVGIFVDRGLTSPSLLAEKSSHHQEQVCHHIAILFIGGPDDREALSYAWRMCMNPRVSLTVIRFVSKIDILSESNNNNDTNDDQVDLSNGDDKKVDKGHDDEVEKSSSIQEEKEIDDKYMDELKSINNTSMSVQFFEQVIDSTNDIVKIIGTMENDFNLIIVGRGMQKPSPFLEGLLSDWSEHPDIGPLGDILVSSRSGASTSILIVQRAFDQPEEDCVEGQLKLHNGHMTWQVHEVNKLENAPFVNQRG